MGEPFIGSEAVASGDVVKSALRTQYKRLFRDVYVNPGTELTADVLARAGWLWSRRRGVIAGLSAAAMHGAKWIDLGTPMEIIHTNRNPLSGLRIRSDHLEQDEFEVLGGIPVTTPARTALDVACWHATTRALAAIDALARATEVKMPDVEALAQRYPGRRDIRRARTVISLVDGGAQSPQESWLRLSLIEAGLPRPQTQIPVRDDSGQIFAYLDMGWEDVKVAVEYDGEHHRNDRHQYTWDIRRSEKIDRCGWIVVRVVAGDKPAEIIRRIRIALARRASRQRD